MYDRSLDLFGPHTPPNLLSLYPYRTGTGFLQSSLGTSHLRWQEGGFPRIATAPLLSNDRLTFLDSYGIGGPGRRGLGRMHKAAMRQMPAAPMAMSEARADNALMDAAMVEVEALGFAATAEQMESDDSAAQASADSPEIRTDFSETAFWQPHLVLDQDGGVSFEFSVPDSVTEWNVWLHSLTRDLRGASTVHQARTVKDLMVRPYLPRFLREADKADITVVVNNAGETTLAGELTFDIVDPVTEESLLAEFGLDASSARRSFSVEPGGGADLGFAIQAPARVGNVAFRVVASAGDLSDGELRPLPVLPGRIHLAQSRFVTLSDQDRRELRFEELIADNDPTRINDQMVVTLDAQLFYSVLSALPYLIDYPYECTEQTLNRFLSTGILSSLFERYPSVQQMATQLSERDTQYEAFDDDDPNRKMLLEESPWLRQSRGGTAEQADLIKVLDPRVALAQRRASFAKLEKAQTSSGGYPWWSGGPPSTVHDPLRARRHLAGSRVPGRSAAQYRSADGAASMVLHAAPLPRSDGSQHGRERLLLGDGDLPQLRALQLRAGQSRQPRQPGCCLLDRRSVR